MDALKSLFSAALVLVALAPVLIAGGACIAAFMTRQRILAHLLFTTACILALLAGAWLALRWPPPQAHIGVLALAGLPWAVYWAGKRIWFSETTHER